MNKWRIGFVVLSVGFFFMKQRTEADVNPPLKKVSLRLDWYPQAEHGGYIYALVHGLYQKAGLDVTILPAAPNDPVEPHVALGRVEFGLSTTDQVLMGRAQGLPLVGIMATMEHDPKAVMVHDDSPVKTFPDLEGHAMAVFPGVTWFLYVTKKYHLKNIRELRSSFEMSTFINTPGYIQECFVTSEPYFVGLHGVKVRTLLVMDTGCDPYRLLITSDSFLAKNPDTVRAFVAASREGWQGYLADPATTDAEIKRRNPEMTQGQLDYSRKTLIDDHFVAGFPEKGEDVGLITDQRMENQYKLLRDLNVITHDIDFHQGYTTAFVSTPAPATTPAKAP